MGLPVGMQPHSDWDCAELTLWRTNMGFSVADACQELGCTAAEYTKWESGAVPRYIALACRALALGMGDIKS